MNSQYTAATATGSTGAAADRIGSGPAVDAYAEAPAPPPLAPTLPHHSHAHQHVDLIDTTEMYLRTVYELEEEGVVPLRARIAERLGQSGPTVSQTVARMERDGLLSVAGDRHLELSVEGRRHAIAVMRKHRLAERLLLDVIGLDWDQVHIEACRWEHVMSDAVERRILALLDKRDAPLTCPHGNPIPGLDDLGLPFGSRPAALSTETLYSALDGTGGEPRLVTVERISEQLQPDDELMRRLHDAGVHPGQVVAVHPAPGGVTVCRPQASGGPGEATGFDAVVAAHVFVRV